MKKLILFFAFLIVLSNNKKLVGQNIEKFYTDYFVNDVIKVKLNDNQSCFALTGVGYLPFDTINYSGIFYMLLDNHGDIILTKIFNDTVSTKRGKKIYQDDDMNILLLNTNNYVFPNGYISLLKLDLMGNVIWGLNFVDTMAMFGNVGNVITLEGQNDYFMFYGYEHEEIDGNFKYFVRFTRITKNGEIVYSKQYTINSYLGFDYWNSDMFQINDSLLYITTHLYQYEKDPCWGYSKSIPKPAIIAVNTLNGDTLWIKKYKVNECGEYRVSNTLLVNNSIYMAGNAYFNQYTQIGFFIYKIDINGDSLLLRTYVTDTCEYLNDFIIGNDSSLLLLSQKWIPDLHEKITLLDSNAIIRHNYLFKPIYEEKKKCTLNGYSLGRDYFVESFGNGSGYLFFNTSYGNNSGLHIFQVNNNFYYQSNRLSGKVYLDLNNNCQYDSTDIPVKDRKLELIRNNYQLISKLTNEDGIYKFQADTGYYKVKLELNSSTWELDCLNGESEYDVYFNTRYDTLDTLDFPLHPKLLCTQPEMEISSNILRRCFKNSLTIKVCNTGTVSETNAEVSLYTGLNLNILSSTVPLQYLPDSGMYIITLGSMAPYECKTAHLYDSVSCAVNLGDTVCFTVNSTGDSICPGSGSYSSVTLCQIIRGSYDPNDMQVTSYRNPLYEENKTLSNSDTLRYLIRFQNTGNDTAFYVSIYDTLPVSQLLPESIEIGASSHPVTYDIIDGHILKFRFPGILLPDSNINEPESHGFVSYRILLKENLPEFSTIKNRAGIIFDFNEPVLTNTATVLLKGTTQVYSKKHISTTASFEIYPNPVTQTVRINYHTPEKEQITLKIHTLSGEIIKVISLNPAKTAIDISTVDIKPGLYFCTLADAQGVALQFRKMAVVR